MEQTNSLTIDSQLGEAPPFKTGYTLKFHQDEDFPEYHMPLLRVL